MPSIYCQIIKHAIGQRGGCELTLFGQAYDIVATIKMGIVQTAAAPDKLLDIAVALGARVPPDCYLAYSFSKRALQTTTMAAIESRRRSIGICCHVPCRIPRACAHALRYRELNWRKMIWEPPQADDMFEPGNGGGVVAGDLRYCSHNLYTAESW